MTSQIWNLTEEDRSKFLNKYLELVGNSNDLLSGSVAKPFLLTSELDSIILGNLWSLVDTDNDGLISCQQFIILMAIAKCIIKGNSPPNLIPPNLINDSRTTGFNPQSHLSHQNTFTTHQNRQTPKILHSSIVNTDTSISSALYTKNYTNSNVDHNLNISGYSNGNINKTIDPNTKSTDLSLLSHNFMNLPPINSQNRLNYIQTFNTLDQQRKGYLSGYDAKLFLSKSLLSNDVLRTIWEIADKNNNGRLTKDEFIIALHLVELAKQGYKIPSKQSSTIPDVKIPSLDIPEFKQATTESTRIQLSQESLYTNLPQSGVINSFDFINSSSINNSQLLNSTTNTQSVTNIGSLNTYKQENIMKYDDCKPISDADEMNIDHGSSNINMHSTIPSHEKKPNLEETKRENFIKGEIELRKRMSDHMLISEKIVYSNTKKASQEKLRIDRENAEIQRKRTNSIKEIKLDKEKALIEKRRVELTNQCKKLNDQVSTQKSKLSSFQAEQENLDMKKIDLDNRLWKHNQIIITLKRDVSLLQTNTLMLKELVPEDKLKHQSDMKFHTSMLATLVSKKEALKRHIKSREASHTSSLKSSASLNNELKFSLTCINNLQKDLNSLVSRIPLLNHSLESIKQKKKEEGFITVKYLQRIDDLKRTIEIKEQEKNLEKERYETLKNTVQLLYSSPTKHIDNSNIINVAKHTIANDPYLKKDMALKNTTHGNSNKSPFLPEFADGSDNVLTTNFQNYTKINFQPAAITTIATTSSTTTINTTNKTTTTIKSNDSLIKLPLKTTLASNNFIESEYSTLSLTLEPPNGTTELMTTSTLPSITPPTNNTQENIKLDPKPDVFALQTILDTGAKFEPKVLTKYPFPMKRDSIDEDVELRRFKTNDSSLQQNLNNKQKDQLLEMNVDFSDANKSSSNKSHPNYSNTGNILIAVRDFESNKSGELSFCKGDIMLAYPQLDGKNDGWIGAEFKGKRGIIPDTYVKSKSKQAPTIPIPYKSNSQLLSLPSNLMHISSKDSTNESIQSDSNQIESIYAVPKSCDLNLSLDSDEIQVQPYKVKAKVAYKGRKIDQLNFDQGSVILVLKKKRSSKWSFGKISELQGWFPDFAVKELESASLKNENGINTDIATTVTPSSNTNSNNTNSSVTYPIHSITPNKESESASNKEDNNKNNTEDNYYKALYDYSSTHEGDLSFKENEIIRVTEILGEWLCGEIRGQKGYLPANFVEKMSNTSLIYDNLPINSTNTRNTEVTDKIISYNTKILISKDTALLDKTQPNVSKHLNNPVAKRRSVKRNTVDENQSDLLEINHIPYMAIATRRFKQRGGSFNFHDGDTIQITKSRAEGKWYYGCVQENGLFGWFPSSFVEKIEIPSINENSSQVTEKKAISPSYHDPEFKQAFNKYRALYDYDKTHDDDLPFKKGDIISKISDEGEWGMGELNGNKGYFPINYVEKLSKSSQQDLNFYAVYSYSAQNDDELSFSKGDQINLVSYTSGTLLRGTTNGKTGLVSSIYLQEIPKSQSESVSSDRKNLSNERDNVIMEIITSEEAYLNALLLVDELIYSPIEKNRLLNNVDQKQIMFNWRQLISISQNILGTMKNIISVGSNNFEKIVDVFIEQIPNIEMDYVKWCCNQTSAINKLIKKIEYDLSIGELNTIWSQDPRSKSLPVTSYLLKPMQRITKYMLLIKRLNELTSNNIHVIKVKLNEAVKKTERLCLLANDGVQKQENIVKVKWIFEHLDIQENELNCRDILKSSEHIKNDRKLIYSGKLIKINSNKELIGFLFSNLLLLTRPQFKNLFSRHISSSNLFEEEECKLVCYKFPLSMENILQINQCIDEEDSFYLQIFDLIENAYKQILLKAENSISCKNWIKYIEEGIKKCNRKSFLDDSGDESGMLAEGFTCSYTSAKGNNIIF